MHLALWLKQHRVRADQVQNFYPSPMATVTATYHTGVNPLQQVKRGTQSLSTVKTMSQRRLHKAFLRCHDPDIWSLLRKALK